MLSWRRLWGGPPRRSAEGGQSIALLAIMGTSLVLLAGIAFDIGLAVIESYRVQRATDAAALAGVVYMPDDINAARTAARAVSRQNGYVHGVSGVNVDVSTVAGWSQRLQVTIDAPGRTYLLQLLGSWLFAIKRTAVGEYVLPLMLGSPQNMLGYRPTQTYWGTINGHGAAYANGDPYSPTHMGAGGTGAVNPDHDPSGYNFSVTAPNGCTQLSVDLYDPGFYHNSPAGDVWLSGTAQNLPTTIWTLYQPDATPLAYSDDVAVSTVLTVTVGGADFRPAGCSTSGCSGAYEGNWVQAWRIGSPSFIAGTYRLNLRTTGNSNSANDFAIRANCTGATAPTVSGLGKLALYSNLASGTTEFYLADVPAEHAGKTMVIRIFDPGDAAGLSPSNPSIIRVVDPGGTVRWTSNQWGQNNGTWLEALVTIPSPYAGGWWRIRYYYPFSATDTTVWQVGIRGNPVHLVE